MSTHMHCSEQKCLLGYPSPCIAFVVKTPTCDACGHPEHEDECTHVIGYDHLNGDHECGCGSEEDEDFEGTTVITIRIPSAEGDAWALASTVETALDTALWDERNEGTIGEAEVSSTWE